MENLKSNFQKKVLGNGMTILFEKRNVPVVSIGIATRFGGLNETGDNRGIAHFIEHMLFKGSEKRPSALAISQEIESKGGELNGFTDDEITAFVCKLPSKHLNVGLDVLGDLVKNPVFDEKELEKERKVIFEEIRMNKDNPMRFVFHEIEKNMFEAPFGFDNMNLGTFETLEKINKDFMKEQFKKVYSPDNLVLCVVGEADFNKIVKFAEGNFGNEKSILEKPEIKIKNKSKIEQRQELEQAHMVFAYHTPLLEDEKAYASKILISYLAEGMSSKLFTEIREKRNLAYGVKGGCAIKKDISYSFVYVGTTKENLDKVKEIILKEYKKIQEEFSEKELEEIKQQLIGSYYISMEESLEQMANLLYSEVNFNAEEFYEFENKIKQVKLEDVKEIAKRACEEFSFYALVPKQ